jgi:ribosome maturation factor RimP
MHARVEIGSAQTADNVHNYWIWAGFLLHFMPPVQGKTEMGGSPIFCLWGGFAMDLNGLLETTVAGMGYELVGVERPGGGRLLRIYIDKAGGINVDDCAAVSQQVSRVLDVENVRYDRLEVSSPGLDRLLKGERDFARFAGQRARVKMRVPVGGQRNFVGVVREASAGRLQLEVDGKVLSLELGNVETARLVPNI